MAAAGSGVALGAVGSVLAFASEAAVVVAGGSELAAVGGTAIGMAGGAAVAGVAVVGGLIALGSYKIYETIDLKVKNTKKQADIAIYNVKVKGYNDRREELTSKVHSLSQSIEAQEAKLDTNDFYMERRASASKVVVVVGPTGYGKSLFCHRIVGNDMAVDELEEMDTAYFNVADYGQAEPETSELGKHRVGVRLIRKGKTSQFHLSMVDTVGAYDAEDEHQKNSVAMYFRASGGINMFCIFFKFRNKADENYKALLRSYVEFWGAEIRKHSVVILTNCDEDQVLKGKKYEKGLRSTKKTLREDLGDIFGEACDDIPIFAFGDGNYVESREKLMLLLNDANSRYAEKYSCENITTPIDELLSDLKRKIKTQRVHSRGLRATERE